MDVAYERRGAGAPLVLIHPLGADRHVWDPVLDRLAARRDVIAVDLPGFGRSAPLNGSGAGAAALAAAVEGLTRELGVERPHVAGNSLGGWVALELAAAGAARSVTAIAPAGLWGRPLGPRPNPARRFARAALPLLPLLLAVPRARNAALAGVVAHPERVPPLDALRLVSAYARAPGYTAANDAMRSGRFAAFDRISVPLTLAWPDHDRLIARPPRLPAGARNVVLHGCGHIPTWDDPEQVAELLLAASAAPA